jgi:hypothetical protein
MAKDHVCFVRGCAGIASFGFRFPGPLSEVPQKFRGYLWSCVDHVYDAEARQVGAREMASADGLLVLHQGDLFMGDTEVRAADAAQIRRARA